MIYDWFQKVAALNRLPDQLQLLEIHLNLRDSQLERALFRSPTRESLVRLAMEVPNDKLNLVT